MITSLSSLFLLITSALNGFDFDRWTGRDLTSIVAAPRTYALLPLSDYDFCGNSLQVATVDNRIVGGRSARDGEFPWQVSIRRYSPIDCEFVHVCGGSIISDSWILTAAHCVYGISEENFIVTGNSTQLTEPDGSYVQYKVAAIITHPDFNEDVNSNDIGLLHLATPLNLARSYGHMVPICLPRMTKSSGSPSVDKRSTDHLTVTGWGTTDEEGDNSVTLMATDVDFVDLERCNSTYRGSISKGSLCAGVRSGGKDSCQGDSGGPLIYRDANHKAYQIGIVSWGEGCGRRGYPGVYVDVSYFKDWIYSTIYQYNLNQIKAYPQKIANLAKSSFQRIQNLFVRR